MTIEKKPLLSVGLPTYNRAASLKRAIDSVLAQDYSNFELIVSDNGSSDDTQSLCDGYSKQDPRVRYIRQSANQGAGFNFMEVLNRSKGPFFMWLGDDDWMGPGYLTSCERFLADNPDYVLVSGRGRFLDGDRIAHEERIIVLEDPDPARRVLAYFKEIELNTLFYGVMRRELLSRVHLRLFIGSDWLFLAEAAFVGKVKTLDDVTLYRDIGGESQDLEQHSLNEGLSKFRARNVHLVIAAAAFSDIAYKSPVYASLPRMVRIALGTKVAVQIIKRFYLPLKRQSVRARLRLRTRFREGWEAFHSRS
jgi:glycosyltransferase domain-containing protein